MKTNGTNEHKQLVNLLCAANAQRQELRRRRNQARTALREDVALLFLESRPASGALLRSLNNRVLELERATEAEAEAALACRVISNFVAGAVPVRPATNSNLPPISSH